MIRLAQITSEIARFERELEEVPRLASSPAQPDEHALSADSVRPPSCT
jgi:hypothetical protein